MSGFHIPVSTERQFARGANVFVPNACGFVIRSGWAFDYVMLEDGQRQITAFHMPGDFVVFEPNRGVGGGVGAATALEVETFTNAELTAEGRKGRTWAAFDRALRTRYAKLSTWMTLIGRKHALARCAHLLCELHERIALRDGTNATTFQLPLQQDHIADAVGLTPVHVNRMLRALREQGLVKFLASRVTVHDLDRLREVAGFDGTYLQTDEVSGAAHFTYWPDKAPAFGRVAA